jgi:ABC-type transporter MlaC component
MKFAQSILAAATIFLAANPAPAAEAKQGKETIDKLVQLFKGWSGKSSDRQYYAQAAKYIDYQTMAQRSLSNGEWKKLTPQQKNEFVSTLRTLVEDRYYTRWHRIFSKGTLTYSGESVSNGDVIVQTQLTLGKKVDPLNWRLDKQGSDMKIVSLSVADADLLNKLSTRLTGRLNKYGFDGLLAWMKNKANIGPGDNSSEQASSGQSH